MESQLYSSRTSQQRRNTTYPGPDQDLTAWKTQVEIALRGLTDDKKQVEARPATGGAEAATAGHVLSMDLDGSICGGGNPTAAAVPQSYPCAFPLRQLTEPLDSRLPFFLPSIYPLGAIPGHCGPAPPCYSPYKSVGTRSGGAEAPQAMCLLIWGGAPQAGSHCNVLVKGFRKEPD